MQSLFSTLFERFGLNAYVSGDYEKAEKWFRTLEAKEPDSLTVLRNLGVILLAKGDAEAAEKYLVREEKLYGKSFHRHAALADLAYARGKRKEAGKRYALALLEPECAPGGRQAGIRPIMEKRLKLCETDENFAPTRVAMIVFEEAQKARDDGDFAKAIEAFKKSATLDETNWPALNNAGSILLNTLKDFSGAAVFFEKAFLMSGNIQVARNLGLARKLEAKGVKK